MSAATDPPLILLTGATGYIGGRLLEALQARGDRVRCMVRRPDRFTGPRGEGISVVAGDVLDPASLEPAFSGVHTACYLVHSLASDDFEEQDRVAAENFGRAALAAGVARIVYLGSATPATSCPSTSAAGRRPAMCCGPPVSRSSSSGPPSSSAPGACPTR
jgi:uncharacterized protein YbjT (DUF2867 family)